MCAFGQFQKDTLVFYFTLNDSDVSTLTINKKALEKAKTIDLGQNVELIGFADTLGTKIYNKNLADQRIQSVLTSIGSDFNTIKTTIVGETSVYGEQANNRCVILIYDKKEIAKKKEVPLIKTLDTLILNLIFIRNKDILLPESRPEVDRLYALVDSTNYISIQIHGHICCGSGMKLSQDRASRIQKYLIRHGVDADKITSYGHSNFQPRVPQNGEANKQINRRVEVVIVVE